MSIASQPLVSVMIPTHNALDTLPQAIASLDYQTYVNWECLIVDDGSTDDTEQYLSQIDDERFTIIRLFDYQGRGGARQIALEHAHGAYIAFLDADDWYYPHKLSYQVDFMQSHPELALVSSGLAIVDKQDNLSGIQNLSNHLKIFPPLLSGFGVPIAFAPSLIRTELAKQIVFNREYHISEDKQFLLNLLRDNAYATLPHVLYAYRELSSVTFNKLMAASKAYRRIVMTDNTQSASVKSQAILMSFAKQFAYTLAYSGGFGENLIRRRSRIPNPRQLTEYDQYHSMILSE